MKFKKIKIYLQYLFIIFIITILLLDERVLRLLEKFSLQPGFTTDDISLVKTIDAREVEVENQWIHHKWEKSGRTFYNPNTGKYMYTSYICQSNVDLGDGNYSPYIWDPKAKIAKFADCELRFFDTHFEFWRDLEELTKSKFKLYKKVGKNWENTSMSFDSLTIKKDDEYGTTTLKLKDEDKNEIIANIQFGLFQHIILDFEVNVNAKGEYRFEMENSGLSGDPREIHSTAGAKGLEEKEDRIIGVIYEKMYFCWSYDEALDRSYLHRVQSNGSETSKKIVELGHLSPGKSKIIYPDQWGPTRIQADADDGEEDGREVGTHAWKTDGYYADDRLFFGYYNPPYDSPFEPAFRWDNIIAYGTINSGTKIELYRIGGGTQPTGGYMYGIDEANPTQFSDVSKPSDHPRTIAFTAYNGPTVDDSWGEVSVQNIVQELVDSYNYNGTQAMAFYWREDTHTDTTWVIVADHGHISGNPAKLTIIYTPEEPNTPTLIRIFDNAIFNAYPPPYLCTLSVKSTDPQGDSIQYEIQWDTDPLLSSPSSKTTSFYGSGVEVTTTIDLNTPDPETLYFWRVRATTLWYDLDWQYRKKITFDHNKVPNTDQNNFPVLINKTDVDWRDISNGGHVGQSDAGDILFTSADGTTKLDHDIEEYVPSAGSLIAWVKVPTVSASTDTFIYIYYGNTTVIDQWNVTGTCDSNFAGVWHLKEDPTGTPPQMIDRTSNSNDGTSNGSMTVDDLIDAKVGKGLDFDGIDDKIAIPDSPSLRLGDGLTIEAWIKVDTWGNWEDIVFKGGGAANNSDYQFSLVNSGLAWDGTLAGTWRTKYFNTSQDTSVWIHAVVTHDTNTVKCYRDGLEISSQADTGAIYESSYPLGIAQEGANYVDGIIDEVRISNVARSADWIITCYNNQNSPSTFYSVAAEEIALSLWSGVRSFTMDMETNDVYWYQVKGTQFDKCTTNYVTVQGDSVILNAGQTEGTLISPPIVYTDLIAENPSRSHWDGVKWSKYSAEDSIGVQIEYKDGGVWSLVQEDTLPGNSNGFFNNTLDFITVDISPLNPSTYDTLRINAIFRRHPGKASNDPVLNMWSLGNISDNITGVPDSKRPLVFALNKIIPNPFTNVTKICYQLPKRVSVNLQIFDIIGRSVTTLVNCVQKPGYYCIQWKGINKNDIPLPTGVYFLKMEAGDFEETQKLIFVR